MVGSTGLYSKASPGLNSCLVVDSLSDCYSTMLSWFPVCEMRVIILPTVHCEDSKKCVRHHNSAVSVELAKVELAGLK